MTDEQKRIVEDIKFKLIEQTNIGDTEISHSNADDLLCELLSVLGFNDIVEIYKKINKWYA